MMIAMEEIILTCLVLTGSVQISDNVTLICASPTEEIVEERGGSSDRERSPHLFTPPALDPSRFEHLFSDDKPMEEGTR